jgi:hypothetical protein
VRPFHGVHTLSWRHASSFNTIVYEKYLSNESGEFRTYLHSILSEYFLGKWSNGKMKPLYYEKVFCKGYDPNKPDQLIFDKPVIKRIKMNANRLVPIQPNVYDDFHVYLKPRYNLRKLKKLPYHLIEANMIKGLHINSIFFSYYNFIY